MKKLYCLLLSATLILISLAPTYAQATTSKLKSNIVHKLLEREDFYMSDRVKIICEEWPKCKEWAMARYKENPSFKIRDAEVEYYVIDPVELVWAYNLYIEVFEDWRPQVYLFRARLQTIYAVPVSTKQYFRPLPEKIKKFPGHPFTNMPAQHSKYVGSEIYKKWPQAIGPFWPHIRWASEQQRVIWDKNGDNPRWERRLDFTLAGAVDDKTRVGALIARQQKLGDPFKYIDAKNSNSILHRTSSSDTPNFSL
jgi:hypothetical protein